MKKNECIRCLVLYGRVRPPGIHGWLLHYSLCDPCDVATDNWEECNNTVTAIRLYLGEVAERWVLESEGALWL